MKGHARLSQLTRPVTSEHADRRSVGHGEPPEALTLAPPRCDPISAIVTILVLAGTQCGAPIASTARPNRAEDHHEELIVL